MDRLASLPTDVLALALGAHNQRHKQEVYEAQIVGREQGILQGLKEGRRFCIDLVENRQSLPTGDMGDMGVQGDLWGLFR